MKQTKRCKIVNLSSVVLQLDCCSQKFPVFHLKKGKRWNNVHHQGWRWSKEQCEIVYLINIKLLKQGTMWNPVFDKRQIVGLKILRNSQEKWTILASSLAVVQSAKINIWWAAATQNLDPKPEQACPKPGSYLNKHVQNLEPTWTSISEERREVKIQEYLDAASGSPDSRSTRTWIKMITKWICFPKNRV